MTLTELLVASILIGIVMIGAFSFSQAVKQIHQSTDRSTIPAARVAAAMAQIRQDAALATGDGHFNTATGSLQDNYGIAHDETGTSRALCFRQDTTPLNTADDTEDYSGGGYEWVCYEHQGDSQVRRCTTNGVPPFPACAVGLRPVVRLPTGVLDFYSVNEPTGQIEDIEITLTTRIDPNQPADPMSNPEFSLSTTLNPWLHGR